MLKKISKLLKNQRGLTLVELLAVVVILGIISAIAVPSIGGLIENSKRDAHIANAQMMVNAAKLAMSSEEFGGKTEITLEELEQNGYLEEVKNPSNKDSGYDKKNSHVVIADYKVVLKSTDTTYLDGLKDPFDMKRSEVDLKKDTTTDPGPDGE
ncbi:competence type IV pilus major pilin ComGC [Lederbergia panacisoli]|uniref:competence type IV pilus major pilin ComGC n=1 Tax=Lederbergia panacisoli TaxID=1255251 RepID=UPI00214C5E12|nr:prepilin-type N-terminal cleavage/methylation domain-containing protein [Lederbergia panacisoli]MCR2820549.1 prepilin-type N-terminal cleavage/methylation domain-containing protein [Lederbergia panacisoli]